MVSARRFAFLFLALPLLGQMRPAIEIDPPESMTDELVAIRVAGLRPNQMFSVSATATDALQRRWSSRITAKADEHGAFDFGRNSSGVDRTASAVEAMRLFWSMQLDPALPAEKRVPPGFVRMPAGSFDVAFELSLEGGPIAKALARRHYTRNAVRVNDVRDEGLIGRLYEPTESGRHAAILVLSGSEGGISLRYAPALASRGYVVFALAYSRIEPLPNNLIEIPIEYFEKAIEWLNGRPSVDRTRVGVIGLSKGGELALLLPALHPDAFRAVVAVSPSSVVWEGGIRDPSLKGLAAIRPKRSSWSWRGKPLAFLPKVITTETKRRIEQEGSVDTIDFYLPALNDAAAVERARIPVENITAPILMVASAADRMWPAALMTAQVAQANRQRDRVRENFVYPDASHVIEDSWFPPVFGTPAERAGRWDRPSLGGTLTGTVYASADAWPKIIEFFGAHLNSAKR